MRELSVSGIENFAFCERSYENCYALQITEAGYSIPLTIGNACHEAGASLREGAAKPIALKAAYAFIDGAMDAALPTAKDEHALRLQRQRDSQKVWAMISGYNRRWYFANNERIYSDQNELIVRSPLINPKTGFASKTFSLKCIIDAVIVGSTRLHLSENRYVELDGQIWLYEMKTTSDSVSEVAFWLRQSIQIPLYQEIYRLATGIVPAGTIIDILKKPAIPKRKGGKTKPPETDADFAQRCKDEYLKDPDRYYFRGSIPYSSARCDWATEVAWRTAQGIRHADKHGYLAVKGPSCKTPWGKWCPYKQLCWFDDMAGLEFDADQRYSKGDEENDEGKKEIGNGCAAGRDRPRIDGASAGDGERDSCLF